MKVLQIYCSQYYLYSNYRKQYLNQYLVHSSNARAQIIRVKICGSMIDNHRYTVYETIKSAPTWLFWRSRDNGFVGCASCLRCVKTPYRRYSASSRSLYTFHFSCGILLTTGFLKGGPWAPRESVNGYPGVHELICVFCTFFLQKIAKIKLMQE